MYWKLALALLLLLVRQSSATDPPQGYERQMSPGGFAALDQIPIQIGPRYESPKYWKIPAGTIRKLYDAAGLPKLGSTDLRSPAKDLRWSVQAIKNHLVERNVRIGWERWTIRINGRPSIKWVAHLSGLPDVELLHPFEGCPTHRYHNWNATPGIRRIGGKMDPTLICQEHFQHRRHTSHLGISPIEIMNPTSIPRPGPGVVSWVLHRDLGSYVKPRPKLADLKELAPFFYECIPDYVMERAEWFDHYYVSEISVYANDSKGPHMLEIRGSFAFENQEHGFQFDDYFDPKVFRRIHCRAWGYADLNNVRPCRKADVLVIQDGNYRLRFMIDARYDPQPELRLAGFSKPAATALKPGVFRPYQYTFQKLKDDLKSGKQITVVTKTEGYVDAPLRFGRTYRVFHVTGTGVSVLDTKSNHSQNLTFEYLQKLIKHWNVASFTSKPPSTQLNRPNAESDRKVGN